MGGQNKFSIVLFYFLLKKKKKAITVSFLLFEVDIAA